MIVFLMLFAALLVILIVDDGRLVTTEFGVPTRRGGGFDLVFSGHLHGGQVRLPVLGPLYAPGRGFFPAYGGGLYRKGGSTLIVSRGLGGGRFRLRINNRPEVVVARVSSGARTTVRNR